jgi:hypothetical protein
LRAAAEFCWPGNADLRFAGGFRAILAWKVKRGQCWERGEGIGFSCCWTFEACRALKVDERSGIRVDESF